MTQSKPAPFIASIADVERLMDLMAKHSITSLALPGIRLARPLTPEKPKAAEPQESEFERFQKAPQEDQDAFIFSALRQPR